MRCVAILLCMFLVSSVSGERGLSREQLLNLLNYAIRLYNELGADTSVIRLNQLMEEPLLSQAYAVVDRVRGWASDEYEEQLYQNVALGFLRRYTLYYFLQYTNWRLTYYLQIHGRYSFPRRQYADYRRLGKFISHYRLGAQPPNLIVSEELARFSVFPLGVSEQTQAPYIRLNLREATPIRFLHSSPTVTNAIISWLYSRPIPHSPLLNRDNEVQLLSRSQEIAISWYREYISEGYIELYRHMSERSWQSLVSLCNNAIQQSVNVDCEMYLRLSTISLLQLSFDFLFSEFNRYDCHPYHRTHRISSDPIIRANQQSLRFMGYRVNNYLNQALSEHDYSFFFYDFIQNCNAIHVGYRLDANLGVTLWFVVGGELEEFLQHHYDYENGD